MADSCCWICLCLQSNGDLLRPCKCAAYVHEDCLAVWQAHRVGTRDEVECRLCGEQLPRWEMVLEKLLSSRNSTSTTPFQVSPLHPVPIVEVVYKGTEHRLAVQPTPEGLAQLQHKLEAIIGVPFTSDGASPIDVCFHCRSPVGSSLHFQGVKFLHAAMHCAAISAAQRSQLLSPEALQAAQNPDTAQRTDSSLASGRPAAMQSSDINDIDTAGFVASSSITGSSSIHCEAGSSSSTEDGLQLTRTSAGSRPQLFDIDIVQYWHKRRAAGGSAASTATTNNTRSSSSSSSAGHSAREPAAAAAQLTGAAGAAAVWTAAAAAAAKLQVRLVAFKAKLQRLTKLRASAHRVEPLVEQRTHFE